jgi:hypothetical protein
MPPINNNQPPPTTTPGQGLDTGTGGFPIDGKRNAYDVGSDVGDELPLPEWSSGQVKVDNAPQDLSDGTKRTLASYLSKTTLGETASSPTSVKNSYPVTHNPSDQPDPVSLKDPAGYPTNPSASSNSTKYVAANTLSSRSDAATSLKMLRGRQLPNGESKVDGHELLRQAAQEKPGRPQNPSAVDGTLPKIETTRLNENSPIKNYSNAVIFNRFNPEGNQYEQTGAGLTAFQFASKYEMGTSTADRDMSYGRLAQIGNALSIRAGLELTSTQEGNNPSGPGADAAALLPGAAQLGISRIDRNTLTAQSVLDDGLFDSIDTDLLTDPAGLSWGTMNNVLDQYAGVSNFGMQLLSVALVVALGVVLALFMKLFSFGGTSEYETVDEQQRLPYGASRYDKQRSSGPGVTEIVKLVTGQVSVWRLLGISPTSVKFEKCLSSGALQFFAIDSQADTASELAATVAVDGLIPASQNPGFYSVMARSFNRSFLLLSDYFVALAKAFGSGAVAGVRQAFSIIDVIRSSRFIKFIDTFGQLGDLKLGSNASTIDDTSKGPGKRFITKIDRAPDRSAGKGRLNNSGLFQSKSAFTALDLLIMPSNIVGLNSKALQIPNYKSNLTEPNYRTISDGRISTETREQLEDILEGEYVPFYIHDVRTNEILSFHAFLTSLTDDYSASYDASEAFGRVEPIKTYKGTARKIGFSFILAASSSDDFDVMWTKINKLTTMVYPQFSEGRKLVSSDGKNALYAPFSQTMTASPMVRVRIGDLIKSNYSKFNLARLFGFFYEDSKISNYTPDNKPPTLTQESAMKKSMVAGNTFRLKTGIKMGNEVEGKLPIPSATEQQTKTDPNLELPDHLVLKIKSVTKGNPINGDDDYYDCVVEVGKDADGPQTQEDINNLNQYLGGTSSTRGIIGRVYNFHASSLEPTTETKNKISALIDSSRPSAGAENSSYKEQVENFMSDEDTADKGNAISKSFRTVGGKGLPGFIESLAFDWYDRVTWTTNEGEGRKAPKMCKVTISFSPFHDITPGLDHKGFNRAPVYPVGPFASRKV